MDKRLLEFFDLIKPDLIRYPGIDPESFQTAVRNFCKEPERP